MLDPALKHLAHCWHPMVPMMVRHTYPWMTVPEGHYVRKCCKCDCYELIAEPGR